MSPASPPETATGVGLGYGIAITISILVLISAIMIASYACVRVKSGGVRSSTDGTDDDQRRQNSEGGEVANILAVLGLEKPMIEAYPKVILGESRRLPGPNNGPCSICLNDYNAKEMIRCIPGCNHCFHVDCVDDWLQISATCPVCRNSPFASPTFGSPVPTPLSDLLPLAFNRR